MFAHLCRALKKQRDTARKNKIRILLERQREQILADCQAEILNETIESQKEENFRAHQGDERRRQDHQLLHELFLAQNWDLCEAHEKASVKWKNRADLEGQDLTQFRGKLVEDRDTIFELIGEMKELQIVFQTHPDPGGMHSRVIGMPSRKKWSAKHLGDVYRKRFCKSSSVLFSVYSANKEMWSTDESYIPHRL